jgi:peptidoglycan/xylan/chitin deacetylase (PgdA/CDA1 family)
MSEQKFPILMYHRVDDSAHMHKVGLNLSGEHCSLERFERHMGYLQRNHAVLSVPEIIHIINTGQKLPEKSVAVTFDDGTKDHCKVVLPILESMGIPATFFVMTDPLYGKLPSTFRLQLVTGDSSKIDEIANEHVPEALRRFAPEHFDKYLRGIDVPDTRYLGESSQATREIKYLLNSILSEGPRSDISKYLLEMIFPEESESDIAQKMFLNEGDIKALYRKGMTIGSHCRSHNKLPTIVSDEVFYGEVVGSHTTLNGILGEGPEIIGYPSGGIEGLSDVRVQLIRETYLGGCTLINQTEVCSTRTDPFNMPRIHEHHFERLIAK